MGRIEGFIAGVFMYSELYVSELMVFVVLFNVVKYRNAVDFFHKVPATEMDDSHFGISY